MVVQKIVPALRNRVDDDHLHSSLFAYMDGLDVSLRCEIGDGKHIIRSQSSIQVGRTILTVDYCDLVPVPCKTIGDKEC